MSKRSQKSEEEKLEIVQLLFSHKKSISQLSKQFKVSKSTILSWKLKYEKDGVDGLKERRTWKKYSQELKEQAVLDYLDGKGALIDVCQRYDISDTYVLRSWIKRYTSGKDLKATSKGYSRMKQGRQQHSKNVLRLSTTPLLTLKTTKLLLRSLVSLTSRFILGCVSLKKMALKVSLIDVEKD